VSKAFDDILDRLMMDRDALVQQVQKWPEGVNLQPLFFSLYGHISPRRQRLVAVAMCRRVAHLLPDKGCRAALDIAERYADREVKRADLASAHQAAQSAWGRIGGVTFTNREDAPRYAVRALASLTHPTKRHFADRVADGCAAAAGCEDPGRYSQLHNAECVRQKRLLLDVLPPVAVDPGWQTSTVVVLARGIYTELAFDRLPILGDALEDAGCNDEDLLGHCRGPGPHIRGCWALDLLLEKE
jgi:hypothetical protein